MASTKCDFPACGCRVSTSTSEPLCPFGESFLHVAIYNDKDEKVVDEFQRADTASQEEIDLGIDFINQGMTAEDAMFHVMLVRGIVEMIHKGKIIDAIKEHRILTGSTLRESRDWVFDVRDGKPIGKVVPRISKVLA